MCGLVVLLVIVSPDNPTPMEWNATQTDRIGPPVSFANVTKIAAQRLHEREIRCQVVLDSRPGEHDGWTLYDCESSDDTVRTIWLKGEWNLDPGKPHVVQGRLKVIYHPPAVIQGERFDGFWEMRLVGEPRR